MKRWILAHATRVWTALGANFSPRGSFQFGTCWQSSDCVSGLWLEAWPGVSAHPSKMELAIFGFGQRSQWRP